MKTAVTIIGAGPYALSTAAFLQKASIPAQLYGEVMGFWHSMPQGMFLRSYYRASNIADPGGAWTLPAFETSTGRTLPRPIPLADFIDYGNWFQRQAALDINPMRVDRLSRNGDSFALVLSNGDTVETQRVIVATGITPFAWRPQVFEGIDSSLVSHSSEHREYSHFSGKKVAVVGAGQSALESAAFLNEAGASTELIVRRHGLRFLRGEFLYEQRGRIGNLLYPAWGVGPPGVNWVMGQPSLFRVLPSWLGDPLARRSVRPAGAVWLRPRLEGVRITIGRTVESVQTAGSQLTLRLDDGDERSVDHVVLGTGYRIDLGRYSFLDPDLLALVRLTGAYPRLSASYESSVPGLHFVGAPAAASAGPGMRFVSHTGFTAEAVTRGILRRA